MTLVVDWTGRAVGANRRLAVGRGRVYSQRQYKAFMQSVALTVRAAAGRIRFRGEISVKLELWIHPRMDVDALVKPCYDAIQASGITPNDNRIRGGGQFRMGPQQNGESRIRLTIADAE